jgi:hypothetical protein
VESGEDRDELVGDPLVDYQLPGVGSTVEALEADGDIAQVGQRHRARRVPGGAHASADRRADRADGGLEAVLGWWGEPVDGGEPAVAECRRGGQDLAEAVGTKR